MTTEGPERQAHIDGPDDLKETFMQALYDDLWAHMYVTIKGGWIEAGATIEAGVTVGQSCHIGRRA